MLKEQASAYLATQGSIQMLLDDQFAHPALLDILVCMDPALAQNVCQEIFQPVTLPILVSPAMLEGITA
jgi:hypothetical protein